MKRQVFENKLRYLAERAIISKDFDIAKDRSYIVVLLDGREVATVWCERRYMQDTFETTISWSAMGAKDINTCNRFTAALMIAQDIALQLADLYAKGALVVDSLVAEMKGDA